MRYPARRRIDVVNNLRVNIQSVRRFLPLGAGVLPGLDLPGRAVLHSVHHAPDHDQRGSLPQSALSHEVRSQQDSAQGHSQDCLRLATLRRYEPAIVTHVLAGNVRLCRSYKIAFLISTCSISQ